MKKQSFAIFACAALLAAPFLSCEKDPGPVDDFKPSPFTGETVASFGQAKESVLREIPEVYLNAARAQLHVAYQHTSHGTHVSYGLYGLPAYKEGDADLFGVSNSGIQENLLDFRDYAIEDYAESGSEAVDLSADETGFIQATRNFLDDPDNAVINVVMWSWCSINGHNVTQNYLPGMQTLINEYGPGGSKIGTGSGKRAQAVIFIFMTGHAETDDNIGAGKPGNQAETIISYCREKKYLCLDYYGIDTHDMSDNFWSDAGDNGDSDNYGGNFYVTWQQDHVLGTDYFQNRVNPGGSVSYGEHNSQHITANRKAYAMWWLLARIAGWDGVSE